MKEKINFKSVSSRLTNNEMKRVVGRNGNGSGYNGSGDNGSGDNGSGGSGSQSCTWECNTDAHGSISRWGYCTSSSHCWEQAEKYCASYEGIGIRGC